MVRHVKRKGTLYLPLLLLIVMIGLLTVHHAGKERDLTSEGSSRNIVVTEGAKGKVLRVDKTDSGYDVHYNEDDQLTNLQLNETLEVTKKETLPVELSLSSKFWAKENKAIYIEKNELIHFDGDNSEIVDTEVQGLTSAENAVYYWKKNRIFKLDTSTLITSELAQTDLPISGLFASDDTDGLYAAVVKREDLSFDVHVFETKEEKADKSYTFNLPSLSGELVDTVDLSQNEEGIHLIYTTRQTHAGTVTIRGYYNLFTASQEEPSFKEIKVYDTFTNSRMRVVDDFNLILTDDGPEVTLSARGMITAKIQSWNVYKAKQVKPERWVANHISATTSISNSHQYVSEGEIFWLDYKGKNVKLMGVSDQPVLVQKAQEYQPSDFVQGFFTGISSLPYGFILLLVSVMWIAPAAILLFCISFWNEDAIEQKRSWVRYSAIGLFAICQYYLMQQFFTPMFDRFSPEYLSFPSYSIFLPILIVLLSALFTQFVRQRQWSLYQEFGYFTMFNTLIVIFLVSPYIV
ncbi:hypothetical protein ACSVDE_17705 [Pseudalkalibacillus sp. Hm43]|uniref:hypothetical protein n=1 Tax=Pseudalkalibacillus sp. Hm43 TaxID=3450742 RepID=UPI003F435CC1